MPPIVDQAVALRVWDWSETSQTALFFTREHGLLRALAKGAKRDKGRFSGGIQMLTRGELVALVRPATELATLTDWDLQEIFRRVRTDLAAHRAALAFVELVQAFLTDRDPHPALWDGLVADLHDLDSDAPPLVAFVRLAWRCLVEAGYTPDFDPAAVERAAAFGFDPARGRLTDDPGSEADGRVWRVRPETVALLRAAQAQMEAPERPGGDRLADADPRVLERAGRLLVAYSQWVLGRELPVSAAILAPVPADPHRPRHPSHGG